MGATNITLADTITTDTGAKVKKGGYAGVAISAGQAVYFDSSTQRYQLAIGTSAAAADAVGVALNTAKAGQPLNVLYEGPGKGVTSLTAGRVYVVSDDSAGDLMEASDLGTGDYACVLLIAKSATEFIVGKLTAGVAYGAGS